MEQKLVVSAIRWSTDPRKIAKMGQEKVKPALFFNVVGIGFTEHRLQRLWTSPQPGRKNTKSEKREVAIYWLFQLSGGWGACELGFEGGR